MKDKKIKIAYFTILPFFQSGIADYVVDVLPSLSVYFDIDIYTNMSLSEIDPFLNKNYDIYSIEDFYQNKIQYKDIWYDIGSSDYWSFSDTFFNLYGGSIFLHDPGHTLKYKQNMIKKAKNIFVFSDYAFNLASSILNTRNNIYRLNLPIYIQDGIANNSTDTINISILGFISRYKKLDLIFESLVNLDKHITYPVQVNITGHVMERILFKKPKGKYRVDSIEKKIERMKNIKIIYHGYVEDSYLREMYLKTDIGIALRSTEDYYGESSRTTIEHMSFGIPMILNDIGFFKELPSEYVYKVKNEHPNDLAKILLRAIVDLKQNRINKNNIKNYIKENHSVKKFSEDILKVYQ